MGKYIHIGNAEFTSVRRDEYVDKSMLIKYVNGVLGTQRKFMCVTRARRFGKSIAAKMLNAYYDESVDSHALFADLSIAKDNSYETNLNKYPVIYLDVNNFTTDLKIDKSRIVYAVNDALSEELRLQYPDVPIDPEDSLSGQLLTIAEHNGKQFFMIIDEWDAICREANDAGIMRQYVDWLRSLFKTSFADRIFAGVYMTGILPIKQYNTQSALNNFEEFSMINPGPLAGYFGFTTDEVHALCKKYDMDEALIKQWYDGYQLGEVHDIYNPYAVMRAIQRRKIASYWTATTTYEDLKYYISMNYEGLKDSVVELLAGNEVRGDVGRFSNDIHEITSRDAVLTLLIHLGYLSYNDVKETVRIPNYEVQREFERTIQGGNWENIINILKDSEALLADTLSGDEAAVAEAIEYAHQDNTSILKYNDENSLASVLSLAYIFARKDYLFVREMPAGKGFADIVLVPRRNVDKPAIVLELKYNRSAETAISQIKSRQYPDALCDYVGEVVLVGISYDKAKGHTCKIDRISIESVRENGQRNRSEKIGQRNRSEKIGQRKSVRENRSEKSVREIGQRVSKRIEEVYMLIKGNPSITREELSQTLHMAPSSIQRYINELKKSRIRRVGSDTKGTWEILDA